MEFIRLGETDRGGKGRTNMKLFGSDRSLRGVNKQESRSI